MRPNEVERGRETALTRLEGDPSAPHLPLPFNPFLPLIGCAPTADSVSQYPPVSASIRPASASIRPVSASIRLHLPASASSASSTCKYACRASVRQRPPRSPASLRPQATRHAPRAPSPRHSPPRAAGDATTDPGTRDRGSNHVSQPRPNDGSLWKSQRDGSQLRQRSGGA